MKVSLLNAKNEIDDKIIDLVADSKYVEVSQLTSIPIMIQEVITEIDNQILSKSIFVSDNIDLVTEHNLSQSDNVNTSNKDFENISLEGEKEVKESKLVAPSKSEDDCVSTMSDLRVGAKILHRTLGIGDILEIQKGTNGYCDRILIKFKGDSEPRVFTCMPATLSRHFVMSVEEDKTDEVLEYKNIVTSTKGLKIGAKLMHKLFGLGEVLSLEYNEKEDTKILTVQFENEENPKKFSCTDKILEKYFGIGQVEKENIEIVDNKENKDTVEEDFQKVIENYNIEIPKELKSLLYRIETIIFRQDKKVGKFICSDYYRYDLGNKTVCKISWGSKFLTLYFNVPEKALEDKKGLLRENRSHRIRGNYKLKIDRSVSLEEVEYYIIQAFKLYK